MAEESLSTREGGFLFVFFFVAFTSFGASVCFSGFSVGRRLSTRGGEGGRGGGFTHCSDGSSGGGGSCGDVGDGGEGGGGHWRGGEGLRVILSAVEAGAG